HARTDRHQASQDDYRFTGAKERALFRSRCEQDLQENCRRLNAALRSAWRRRPTDRSMGNSIGDSMDDSLGRFLRIDPADELIEPGVARLALPVHPKAVAAGFIVVQLDWPVGGAPAFNQPETLLTEQGIVSGKSNKDGRRIGRWLARHHLPVNEAREIGPGIAVIGKHDVAYRDGAGREADHAEAMRIEAPFVRPGAHQPDCRLRIEKGDILSRQRSRRPRFYRDALTRLHFFGKLRCVWCRWHGAVLENEGCDAARRERFGNLHALTAYCEDQKSSTGSDNHAGARPPGGRRQNRTQGRNRDVPDAQCGRAVSGPLLGIGVAWSCRWRAVVKRNGAGAGSRNCIGCAATRITQSRLRDDERGGQQREE